MKRIKSGGRKIGTPNKVNAINRAYLSNLLNSQYENISIALQEVFIGDKKAYLQFILKLVEFTIPRLEPIPVTEEPEEQKQPQLIKIGENEILIKDQWRK